MEKEKIIKLRIYYTGYDVKENVYDENITVCFPAPLANELLNKKVRIQMRYFIDNLALLQGYAHGEFLSAIEVK